MTAARSLADNVIEFVGPILGFEDEREFALSPLEQSGTLWALESTRTPALRFVVATPQPFFPGYLPEVAEDSVAPLDAGDGDLTVLVILTVDGPIRTATANLLAPVVLAPKQQRAMQIVLRDDSCRYAHRCNLAPPVNLTQSGQHTRGPARRTGVRPC